MPEFIQNYNFNSLYICLLFFTYNIWKSNYEYINIILEKIYLCNSFSIIIIINIIGLYIFLRNLSIGLDIKLSINYKKPEVNM